MKNTVLLVVFLLLVSAFIVSRGRSTSRTENYGSQSDSTLLQEETSTPTGSTSAKPITNQEQGMKTLQDFEKISAKSATIKTSKGDIVVELYPDKVPLTVTNFLSLAKQGYYNGIKFHRIIEDFMAQAGDPLTKDDSQKALWGTGGPGYMIADEFDPSLKHDSEGILSMANAGPNTGGSQFFITYEATPWLDGKHAVFGKVTSGMDVLRKLQIGDEIVSITF
jgi:cyclophilin family peptidyl-prolyl cis-trans isomerase